MHIYLAKRTLLVWSLSLALIVSLTGPYSARASRLAAPPNITVSASCDGAGNSNFNIKNIGGDMTVNYSWEIYQNSVFLTSGPFMLSGGASQILTITGLYGSISVAVRDENNVELARVTAL